MINVQVNRTGTENNASVIRKFTRKVQESGVLNRVRSIRYSKRAESPYVRKKKTLKSLSRKQEVEHLIKLGRIRPREMRSSHR